MAYLIGVVLPVILEEAPEVNWCKAGDICINNPLYLE